MKHTLSPKSEAAYLVLWFFLHGKKYKDLSYICEAVFWNASNHYISKIFREDRPLSLCRAVICSLEYVSGHILHSSCLFIWSNYHNIINIADQALFCTVYNQDLFGDFPGGLVVKSLLVNAGDMDSIPSPGRSHMLQGN